MDFTTFYSRMRRRPRAFAARINIGLADKGHTVCIQRPAMAGLSLGDTLDLPAELVEAWVRQSNRRD